MNEMIERVARAIKWSRVKDDIASTNYTTGAQEFIRDITSENTIDLDLSDLDAARAAIEVMREPTQDMAAVGKHALETSARGARQLTDMGHSVITYPHLAAWRAMIDELLSDKSK